MLKCCHMQSLDPLPSHQSSPSHQAHQHEPPKCQIFNNQSNPMPNLLHEAGSQTISFAQWQPCTRRSSTWGMNVSYLSCCVEEKQNAFNMLKEELCTSRSFPSALSSLYWRSSGSVRALEGRRLVHKKLSRGRVSSYWNGHSKLSASKSCHPSYPRSAKVAHSLAPLIVCLDEVFTLDDDDLLLFCFSSNVDHRRRR
jgi:hypothetical protein